jgi:hypothetical protein
MFTSNQNTYITLTPNKTYRIHGFIKTQSATGGTGAHIDAKIFPSGNFVNATQFITGTTGWTETILQFGSGTDTQLQIWCRLGHWGGWGDLASGTAWFDAITIEQLP